MKIKNKILTLLLLSTSIFAAEPQNDLWLRVGGGLGFSDWNTSEERHEKSHLMFLGIRPSTVYKNWEFSIGLDVQKYVITNKLRNHPTHYKAEHDNENLLMSISPKLILDDNWRVGPYLGRYVDKNITRHGAGAQDVVGIEADYRMNHKWMTSMAIEHNIDHGAKHRVAKLSIAYNFGEEPKPAPVVAAAPACEDEVYVAHFDFDADTLSIEEKYELMKYVSEKGKLAVRAHTDERGSDDYNYDLAKRRALHVISLIEDKVESMQVLGEHELLGDEHKLNRRVEVIDSCK